MFDNEIFVMYDKDFITKKDLDNKLLLVMAYLMMNVGSRGKVGTTIEHMVQEIGYKPNRHKGKINDKIVEQLKWLEVNNHIFICQSLDNLSEKMFFQIEINKENNIFDMSRINKYGKEESKPYVSLNDTEYTKITTSKTKSKKDVLLRIFLNIKKRINFDSVTPRLCYPSHNLIARDSCVSKGYLTNTHINELIDMGILFRYKTGGYRDSNGSIKNANDVYAVNPEEFKDVEQIMLNYYNEKGIKIDSFIPYESMG